LRHDADVSVSSDPRAFLRHLFDAAVASAQPALALPPCLPPKPAGRTIVVGAGKASASMARALEDRWDAPLEGLVVTRYGHGVACRHIEVIEAAHPVPDDASVTAAKRMLQQVAGLQADDLVIALISGGGSALLALPLPGVALADKQHVNRALLASGATISEINCVRRHLSAIKGGRLAAACHPARVVTLAISDVPGDDPIDIASGPTVADPTSVADALEVLRRYRVELPASVRGALERATAESVKPGDPRLAGTEYRLIATPQKALEAAAEVARAAGVTPMILSDRIEGEARDVGKALAGIGLQVVVHGPPLRAPCVLLSGGETTVTLRGNGRGGRNVEFLLALALALQRRASIYALAADTDGVDGAEEVAGAFVTPDTLERARIRGRDPARDLERNDAHAFFAALDDRIVTGPTRTNVNDFRAIVVMAP
jgi:hydroxypyruvate reductase